MLRRVLRPVLVGFVTISVGCGLQPSHNPDALRSLESASAVVTLHFSDASVPPPYHRSYDLTVQRGEVHVVVDSYGDVLDDVTVDLPDREWEEFLDQLPDAVEGLSPAGDDVGCAGDTGMDFTVTDGQRAVYRVSAGGCSGASGELKTQLNRLMEPFANRVDLDKLTEPDQSSDDTTVGIPGTASTQPLPPTTG